MLEVIWRPSGRRQLDGLIQYIRDRDIAAAERMEAAFRGSIDRLRIMPYLGRPGRVVGTREWVVHPNYLLIYRIENETLVVLRALHARQRYP